MAFEKRQWFALLILILGGIGTGLLLGGDFAGLYHYGPYPGYGYACLTCVYNSSLSLTAIIIGATLLALQAIFALNELIPNRFIKPNLASLIMILGIAAAGIIVAGGVSFAVEYEAYEWWFEGGFYVGLVASIVNVVLSILLIQATRK